MNFNPSDIIIIVGSIFVCMAFHEAMHAFVAHWLGDSTARDMGRLTLNPLKHIDLATTIVLPVVLILLRMPPIFAAKPVPFNPDRVKFDEFGAALVGIAGPLTNLVLAILGAGLLRGLPDSAGMTTILLIFIKVNVAFFVFNMIPFPPLDGSRLLYAVAPEPLQRVMLQIEQMGFGAILILFAFLLLIPGFGSLISFVSSNILHLLVGSVYLL